MTDSGLDSPRGFAPTRNSWLYALAVAVIGLSSIASGGAPQQQSPDSTLSAPRVGLLSLRYPEMKSLDPDVREQLQFFQKQLAALAGNLETTEAELGEAYGQLGQIYHAYSLSDAAEVCYLNANRIAPQEFRWIYLLGYLYHKMGRLSEAAVYYAHARRLRSESLSLPVHLGDVLAQQNRPTEAAVQFEQALKIDSSCGAAHFGLGQLALSSGKHADAVGHFEKALASAPAANRIHYSLALAYRGLGDMERAETHLKQRGTVGIRVADHLVDGLKDLLRGERVHLIRGRMAFAAGRLSEAAAEFDKAVAARPTSIPARVNLGTSWAQLGKIEAAVEQFREVLRLDPGNPTAHYNLGFLLAGSNRPAEALPHLQVALGAYPEDSGARFLLAQAFRDTGQLEQALAEFSRVLQSDPANEEALLQQVNLLVAKKRFREALDQLEQANRRFPSRGRTAHTLALFLASSPDLDLRDGARALDLELLVFKASKSVSHGVTVAMALAELGRCEEAAQWQRRMIAAAEKAQKSDLVESLKVNLERYEKDQPCRPPN